MEYSVGIDLEINSIYKAGGNCFRPVSECTMLLGIKKYETKGCQTVSGGTGRPWTCCGAYWQYNGKVELVYQVGTNYLDL